MKINQWTLGLAAVGVVSLASAVNAEESTMNAIQTALSATTISGYVDTSLEWDNGDDYDQFGGSIPFRSGKMDGFNLNVVKLTIEKAMDEAEWAAGYKVDLLFGPDAQGWNNSANSLVGGTTLGTSEVAIKQAYVALRTPVGNGIDWKMGVFDTIIGYEVFESGNNPNFTRSYGYGIQPTQHTGLLGTYRITDTIAVAAGVANTEYTGINLKDNNASDKTWMASASVSAPEDMGFLSGSTLYGGVVLGSGSTSAGAQDNYYVGATMNTPVTGLKAGASFDVVTDAVGVDGDDAWAAALYLSFQASEKLSLHGRAEMIDYQGGTGDITALTATAQYDLWANVISRAEVRYDNQEDGSGGTDGEDAVGAFLNVIYTF